MSMFRGGIVDEDKITCQSCQPFFGSPLSLLMKNVNVNGRLTEENNVLKKQIASIDENAIIRLRNQKEAEIKDLHARLDKAESEAVRSGNMAYREHQRADESEGQIREMLGIPEIKKVWDCIQQNKKAF